MNITAARLRQFIESVEQVNAEIAEKTEFRREIFSEAKAEGFDPRAMKAVISMRKQKPDDLAEFEAVLDVYKSAVGMV